MTTTLDSEDRKALRSMNAAIEVIRGIQSDIAAPAIVVFLLVASAPQSTLSMVELAERLGMSQASVSRNVAMLSKINRHKEPGYDLLRWDLDPQDFRRKVVTLTARGQRLAARMSARLQGATEDSE